MIHNLLFAGAGYVLGAFTPGVLRTIKSWFVSESKVVEADVTKKL